MRLPQVCGDHYSTHRFGRETQMMHFGQLLMRQRRSKIGVARLDQRLRFLIDLRIQLVVAGAAASLGNQRFRAACAVSAPQALDLAHAQA
jgi:hypothetical protein